MDKRIIVVLLCIALWTLAIISIKRAMAVDLVIGQSVDGREVIEKQPGFGTFDVHSKKYLERQKRRWRQLCKGGGRYQAMAEAYEMGRSSPCQ